MLLDKFCYFIRELIYLNCVYGLIVIVSELNLVLDVVIEGLCKCNMVLIENFLLLIKNGVVDGLMWLDIGKLMIYFIMGGVNWILCWYCEDGMMLVEDIVNFYIEFLLCGVVVFDGN